MKNSALTRCHYVSGKKTISDIGRYIALTGRKALVLGTQSNLAAIKPLLADSCRLHQVEFVMERFNGHDSRQEINRMVALAICKVNANIIVAIGNGRVAAIGEAVAALAKLPVMVIPVSAVTETFFPGELLEPAQYERSFG